MLPVYEILDATWPAKSTLSADGFTLRVGEGGIKRISCATLAGPLSAASIDAAEAAQAQIGQQSLFMIRPDLSEEEGLLDAELEQRGYQVIDPVTTYHAPVASLTAEIPPITAFAHWPPLQILRDLWAENAVGAARQAVMERACAPKAALLGRLQDRAAGGAFVAIHRETAMLHALCTAPHFQRQGLGRYLIHEAANWAAENGARDFTLVVTRNNPANALYRALGMRRICDYHYRVKADT